MSWIQKLYDTYEQCQLASSSEIYDGNPILLPVSHTIKEAHLEITVDQDSNFRRAKVIPKNESRTIIPCTEESGGRTGSKPKPHPLCDKLQFVAKDFTDFGGLVTSGYSKNPKEPFIEYEKLLSAWCESQYSHPKAIKVLGYIRKGTVIRDLIDHNILLTTEGKLIDQWSGKQIPEIFTVTPNKKQGEAFVRWNVEIPGDPQSRLDKDSSLFDSWTKYYESTKSLEAFCYVSGKFSLVAENHPNKLRSSFDSAKIISSNDKSGFTFRGRFQSADQACTVSYDASQKAHNALRWLIGKQGYHNDDQVIVAWSTNGNDIPDPLIDSFHFLGDEVHASTSEEYANKLNNRIRGYHTKLGNSDDIVIMALESASKGRLSITFYRELTGSDFLKRIEEWYETFSWWTYRNENKTKSNAGKKKGRDIFIGTPAPIDVVKAAYGERVEGKLSKSTVQRLLPCIIDGARLPIDLVQSTVRRASNRIGMKEEEWEKTLGTACALYRKYHINEGFNMVLEEDRTSRDYLYGRLLALADNMESWALNESGEDRPTTAARYMNRFAEHPYSTWKIIYIGLTPYKTRLGKKVASREKLIAEVASKFTTEDFKNDKKLSGEFLLGYYCQNQALWSGNKSNTTNQNLENEGEKEVE
jgi:CRISPR-associated protein Csd1